MPPWGDNTQTETDNQLERQKDKVRKRQRDTQTDRQTERQTKEPTEMGDASVGRDDDLSLRDVNRHVRTVRKATVDSVQ